jgi:predicted  nucleic acid-binding Zn-ribbon protein
MQGINAARIRHDAHLLVSLRVCDGAGECVQASDMDAGPAAPGDVDDADEIKRLRLENAQLRRRAVIAEENVAKLQTRAASAEENVAKLQTRAASAEENVAKLQEKLTSVNAQLLEALEALAAERLRNREELGQLKEQARSNAEIDIKRRQDEVAERARAIELDAAASTSNAVREDAKRQVEAMRAHMVREIAAIRKEASEYACTCAMRVCWRCNLLMRVRVQTRFRHCAMDT